MKPHFSKKKEWTFFNLTLIFNRFEKTQIHLIFLIEIVLMLLYTKITGDLKTIEVNYPETIFNVLKY